MFEDLNVDPDIFNLRYTSNHLGVFEPVSAIMFLNVSDEQFERMRASVEGERELAEIFHHEMYHCFQTYATGYLYNQCLDLVAAMQRASKGEYVVLLWPLSFYIRFRLALFFRVTLRKALPRRGDPFLWKNIDAMWVAFLQSERLRRNQEFLARRAEKFRQPSVWGALRPTLHAQLNAVRGASQVAGVDGLSAQDVIEGSAYIYGKISVDAHYEPVIEKDDLSLPVDGPYRRLLSVSRREFPGCRFDLLLAAASLALRYQGPGNAYLPLLRRIHDIPVGEVVPAAGRIAAELPAIPHAGDRLGSALDVHQRRKSKTTIYNAPMNSLASGTWGINEIDLLVTPEAIGAIPPGQLGFGIVTRESRRGFADSPARVIIGTSALENGPSVATAKREYRKSMRVLRGGRTVADPSSS